MCLCCELRISKNCVQALSLLKTAYISFLYRRHILGERLLVLANTFSSKQPKKKLTNVGPRPNLLSHHLSAYIACP